MIQKVRTKTEKKISLINNSLNWSKTGLFNFKWHTEGQAEWVKQYITENFISESQGEKVDAKVFYIF